MIGCRGKHTIATKTCVKNSIKFSHKSAQNITLLLLRCLVLDNASIHTAGIIKERLRVWQERGLFVFYLPRYSPHLNIAEVLWRKLKYQWLSPLDYVSKEMLFYTVRQALSAVGTGLRIGFSRFNYSLI